MNRRQYVTTVALIGASTATAGCLSALTGKNPRRAEELLGEAEELMIANSDYFGDFSEDIQTVEVSKLTFDESYVQRRVEQARELLQQVEQLGTESQVKLAEAMYEWLDVQEAIASVYVSALSGLKMIDESMALNGTQQYDEALVRIETATTQFETATTQTDVVRQEAEDIDKTELDGLGNVAYQDLDSTVEQLDERMGLLLAMTNVFRNQIDGNRALVSAGAALAAQDYEALGSRASEAVDAYTKTLDEIESIRATYEAPPLIITTECEVTHDREAAVELVNASEDLIQGEIESGNEHINTAQEAIDMTCR